MKRHISFRVDEQDLAVIDQLRKPHGLDRTAYLIRAARQELDSLDTPERLADIEHRLDELERWRELGFGT